PAIVLSPAAPSRFRSRIPFPTNFRPSTPSSPRCSRCTAPTAWRSKNLFHAVNARSALKLGHARGVAMLAAVEAGVPIVEYTPAEVKQAVVGYGRAEKSQVQMMIQLI